MEKRGCDVGPRCATRECYSCAGKILLMTAQSQNSTWSNNSGISLVRKHRFHSWHRYEPFVLDLLALLCFRLYQEPTVQRSYLNWSFEWILNTFKSVQITDASKYLASVEVSPTVSSFGWANMENNRRNYSVTNMLCASPFFDYLIV